MLCQRYVYVQSSFDVKWVTGCYLLQGLDFLSSLQVMPDIDRQEITDWISFFLGFVDFTKENSVDHVKMVLEKTRESHLHPYKSHIEEKVNFNAAIH